MRVVDTNVIEACTWCLKDVERKQTEFLAKVEAIQAENACIKLRDITNLNCIADKHRGEIRKIEAELSDLDTEVHELFDEREDFQGWNIIDLFGQHPAEFRVTDLAYTIAEVRESGYGFEIEYIEGGQGHRHWIVRTKRHAWNNRLYRVEFYTERRTRNQEQIGHLKQDLFKQNDALQVLVNAMGTLEASGPKEDSPEIKMERMQIQTEQNKLFKVIALAGRIALHPKLFKAIAEAGVYESGPEEVTARVTEFYSELTVSLNNIHSPQIQPNIAPARSREEDNTYNVLLIGPPQAGKSALAAIIGQFLSPGSEIDFSHIGDGSFPCTREVRVVDHVSHFPEFELIYTNPQPSMPNEAHYYPNQEAPGLKVTISSIMGERYHRQYKQDLSRYDYLEVRQVPPSSQEKLRFRIFDTPGLEDTSSEDANNITKILQAVTKTDKFHLVLVTIPFGSYLSPGLQNSLIDIRNTFSDMRGIVAFVHTKVDPLNTHPEEKEFSLSLEKRQIRLDEIMGREIPHFVINSYLREDRPMCIFLRQDKVREILSLARSNTPVPVNRMPLAKTSRMRMMDEYAIQICSRHREEIEQRRSELQDRINAIQAESDGKKGEKIAFLEYLISNKQRHVLKVEAELSSLETDDLELIAEKTISETWLFSRVPVEVKVTDLEHTIDEIQEENTGFGIESVDGGQGHNHWTAKIKRLAWSNGSFHVKFHTKRRNKNQKKIGELKSDLGAKKEALQAFTDRMAAVKASGPKEEDPEITEERMKIQKELNKTLKAITRAKQSALYPSLFKAVAEAGVYEDDPEESAMRVAKIYTDYVPAEGEESV
ncbi:hypothetical protein BGW38_004665 [Lunasporangiospora selenospora]|uniref:Uncharacterized protein n=1 Tax=Lunasporangiospora selenospora TaxID=979761 RepID=A0A9P6KBV9_9FUNG|nr:hypothetical protein BGW38_004665 [Lunasporangiospora selenospora]